MKVAIMQPYFFPYLGYWQLMNAVDKYVIFDDVNYIKRGWIHRNRILVHGQAAYFNLPKFGGSQNQLINEVKVNNDPRLVRKNLSKIEASYKKAPYYADAYPIVRSVLECGKENTVDYLLESFRIVGDYLGIKTELIMSSHLEKDCSLRAQEKVLAIQVDENVPVLPSHRWMTLGQIKELACSFDNMVNMDTRTVLSGIPYIELEKDTSVSCHFQDRALFQSVFEGNGVHSLPKIYHNINNYKMFHQQESEFVPLHRLKGWRMTPKGIIPEEENGFRVIYCQIEIEGREVRRWSQPLFEATGISTFGLVLCDIDGVTHFLVQALPEPGCFDGIELGPSIQLDAAKGEKGKNCIEGLLEQPNTEVLCDVLLSEEGGRFYHEQNRNLLLRVSREQLKDLPENYFLLDYRTLNMLCQINNCLNIQLRNLLSLLRI